MVIGCMLSITSPKMLNWYNSSAFLLESHIHLTINPEALNFILLYCFENLIFFSHPLFTICSLEKWCHNHLTKSYLFFTTWVVWCLVYSYSYSITVGFTEIFPSSKCISMILKVDYPLFIMGPKFSRIGEIRVYWKPTAHSPVIYSILKKTCTIFAPIYWLIWIAPFP